MFPRGVGLLYIGFRGGGAVVHGFQGWVRPLALELPADELLHPCFICVQFHVWTCCNGFVLHWRMPVKDVRQSVTEASHRIQDTSRRSQQHDRVYQVMQIVLRSHLQFLSSRLHLQKDNIFTNTVFSCAMVGATEELLQAPWCYTLPTAFPQNRKQYRLISQPRWWRLIHVRSCYVSRLVAMTKNDRSNIAAQHLVHQSIPTFELLNYFETHTYMYIRTYIHM